MLILRATLTKRKTFQSGKESEVQVELEVPLLKEEMPAFKK